MAEIGKSLIIGIIMVIFLGVIGLALSSVGFGDGEDGYCEEETQFISDQDWYELCK